MNEIKNAKQREYRAKTKNACTNKYEKSKRGYLMRKYRNMLSRISGVQKQKAHLYKGKSLISKDEFYVWALNNPEFHTLFDNYEKNYYNRKLAPTVDRIDSSLGYELNNMRWITHSENSRLGALSKNKRIYNNTIL